MKNITNTVNTEQLQQMFSTVMASGMLGYVTAVIIFISLLSLIARWKLYSKAGRPGWYALIPFLNGYTLWDISMGKGILFLTPLLSVIPVIGGIIVLVLNVKRCLGLSERFGKGTGFGIGLWLLDLPFMCVLGFGGSEYNEENIQQDKGESLRQYSVKKTDTAESSIEGVYFTPWRISDF